MIDPLLGPAHLAPWHQSPRTREKAPRRGDSPDVRTWLVLLLGPSFRLVLSILPVVVQPKGRREKFASGSSCP